MYVDFVFPYAYSRRFNQLQHLFLPRSQIIYGEAELTVYDIKLFQLVVHIVCLLFKLIYFSFSRCNITFEILDPVIQNEFKLLKFLSLLLQLVDNFFTFADLGIFIVNLCKLLPDQILQFVNGILLLIQLGFFVLYLPFERFDF